MGLNRHPGGIFKEEGLNSAKTMVSILHKELEYKEEKLKYERLEAKHQ